MYCFNSGCIVSLVCVGSRPCGTEGHPPLWRARSGLFLSEETSLFPTKQAGSQLPLDLVPRASFFLRVCAPSQSRASPVRIRCWQQRVFFWFRRLFSFFHHVLLQCPQFDRQRYELSVTISNVFLSEIQQPMPQPLSMDMMTSASSISSLYSHTDSHASKSARSRVLRTVLEATGSFLRTVHALRPF